MGTTTKMAIPYPEATGLVKDGWEDMKDIANQVDAKSGLVLVNTTNFTGVSSQSLANNTFTTNFSNYRIIVSCLSSSASGIGFFLKMRASGTDASTGYYGNGNYWIYNSATTYTTNVNNGTQVQIGGISSSSYGYVVIELGNPYVAKRTVIMCADYGGDDYNTQGRYTLNNTNLYDSASFIPASGTITGSITVYGYNA